MVLVAQISEPISANPSPFEALKCVFTMKLEELAETLPEQDLIDLIVSETQSVGAGVTLSRLLGTYLTRFTECDGARINALSWRVFGVLRYADWIEEQRRFDIWAIGVGIGWAIVVATWQSPAFHEVAWFWLGIIGIGWLRIEVSPGPLNPSNEHSRGSGIVVGVPMECHSVAVAKALEGSRAASSFARAFGDEGVRLGRLLGGAPLVRFEQWTVSHDTYLTRMNVAETQYGIYVNIVVVLVTTALSGGALVLMVEPLGLLADIERGSYVVPGLVALGVFILAKRIFTSLKRLKVARPIKWGSGS